MVTFFVVVEALWLFLPAYIANMTPPVAAKILPKWSAPIDGGRVHRRDGRPVLGTSKTWRGLVSGGITGAATAAALAYLRWTDDLSDFALGATGSVAGPLAIGLFLGLGAGVGDAVKSYFKRRTGRQGGAPWIPFDQLDFVVAGLAFGFVAATILWIAGAGSHWFMESFVYGDGWAVVLVLLLLTPALHFLVNVIAYWLGFKKVPW